MTTPTPKAAGSVLRLDCASRGSTKVSVLNVFGCTGTELRNFLEDPELLPAFEQRWKPAVVKFTAPAGDSAGYAVAVALCYLRDVALLGRPGQGAVWCFDGHNMPVPAERIVAVEWVGEPVRS